MNKQEVIEINKEFVKLVTENPELPIKVFIDGECHDDDASWFVGEVFDCRVTEIVTYGNVARVYEKADIDIIEDDISDNICDYDEYFSLSDEEFNSVVKKKAEELPWEKVILIEVGV